MDIKDYYINHKTFIAALESFATNKQKFKRYYNDKRLTHQEKSILKAKIAIRNFKLEDAMELLNITPQNDFIKAHYLFIKGTVYNNNTLCAEAAPLLKESYQIFMKLGDPHFAFPSLHTLLLALYNLKISNQMEFFIKEMKKMHIEQPFRKSCQKRCESLYHSLIDENDTALEKINEALSIKSEEMEDQKAIFLVTKFVVLFKLHRHVECELVFKEYQDTAGFTSTANYNFMKKMLEHLMYDTPLYAYKKHFKDAPELEYQANVVNHLSCGEVELAEICWNKLREMNSVLYGENYNYTGDYCLFSACLQKHLNTKAEVKLDLVNFQGSIQEKLVYILESSNKPLTKEDLITMLWQEDWSEESSARFNTLMSRTKKKFDLDVRVRKGSYQLHKKNKAA